MSKIKVLPDSIISKIAAGEVIERPASIVKELVENSIDAGARRIEIQILSGGLEYLRIVDDGEGMSREDLSLAFQRHATSKLKSEDELFAIETMGFRGEALASIASVSEVIVLTKEKGELAGNKLRIEGGNIKELEEAGFPEGTSIEVLKLFYNVPVRKKFMKSSNTELGHILDTVHRYAFSHPYINFKVLKERKTILNLPEEEDVLKRVFHTFGKAAFDDLIGFENISGDVSVRGYGAFMNYSLPNRKGIFVYVNSRWVRDRLINHALHEAFRTVLPKERFPLCLLFLSMPADTVDVNVHPSKTEVRFKDSRLIYNMVKTSIEEGIKLHNKFPVKETEPYMVSDYREEESVDEQHDDYLLSHQINEELFDAKSKNISFSSLHVVGQLWSEFIVCESGQVFVIIDQHAAHERIAFERLKDEYEKKGFLQPEMLLIPQLIKLSAKEMICLEEKLDTLNSFGFDIEPFGDSEIALKAVPNILKGRDVTKCIRDALFESDASQGGLFVNSVEDVLMRIACHSVIRGRRKLGMEEIKALLGQLDAVDASSTCPHGRPIVKSFHRFEVERFFNRR